MMPVTARIPPGRAGRIWLRHRLAAATRGRDQLDRKLRILIPERQRLAIRARRSSAAWEDTCDTARMWLLRAELLGGQDALRAATASRPIEIETTWAAVMGVRYPVDVHVVTPAGDPLGPPGNAAVAPAVAAFRAAVTAGTMAAAAEEALRRVEAEIAVTRRRLRALDKRWLPWLNGALTALDAALDQAEQDDGVRVRRSVHTRPERSIPP